MRYLTILLSAALMSVGIGIATAADTRPSYERTPCSETRKNNCFIDATTTKQADYSHYRIRIGDRVAVVYWNTAFAREHNHMEPLSTAKVVRTGTVQP